MYKAHARKIERIMTECEVRVMILLCMRKYRMRYLLQLIRETAGEYANARLVW